MQKEYLYGLVKPILTEMGVPEEMELVFEKPKNESHGDLSTNIAMKSSKVLKKNPREIANKLIDHFQVNEDLMETPTIAGPGFINFKFKHKFYNDAISIVHNNLNDFGKLSIGKGKKANVEYVSANPTGLLHLGHGRNAAIGDTVANLLEWNGYNVVREYYFNNAGNQMNNLAKSIYARYRQLEEPDFPFPEDGYFGDYIKEIAVIVKSDKGNELIEETQDNIAICKDYGEKWCFEKILNTLKRMNINQDVFYNEDTLYKEGKIQDVIDKLKEKGLAYDKDGALWFKLTELGLEDDRVIVKATGEPTYRLPDIAYHREKFLKGYDLIVDVFGADHIATVPDVMAGVKALGFNSDNVKILIHQFVTLVEEGEVIKMSKRSGKSYTLDDLLDEVGEDVVRFFLIMRGISTHMEFDLSLAKEQSEKNPVFYLQYAHARICSVFDKVDINIKDISYNFNNLVETSEINLIKMILAFPEIIENAAKKLEPQMMTEYLKELASTFHVFYHNCRIIGEDQQIMKERLLLLKVTKHVLYSGLGILGVSAPERM